MNVSFILNGKSVTIHIRPGTTLMDYLREQCYFSVKFGSEKGETGADTVLVNDRAMNASLLLIHTVEGKSVETLESFTRGVEAHPLQEAFVDEGAIQCGYCTPGMILAAEALIRENPAPTETDVREALAGVYCRCTGYVKPVEAVLNYSAAKNPKNRQAENDFPKKSI